MADDKDLTQQTSAVDDGLNKSGNVKEANVASVALGMFSSVVILWSIKRLLQSTGEMLT